MLIVEYIETNGLICPDAEAIITAQSIWDSHLSEDFPVNNKGEKFISVSSEILVHAFRILVLRKIITVNEIMFKYKNTIILVDKDGRLNKWPKGFCDTVDNFLMELLDCKEL